MVLCCSSVRASRNIYIVNTICCRVYLTHIFTEHIKDVLWDRYECVKFCDQKVKGQGHDGMPMRSPKTVLSGLVNMMS